MVNERDKLLEAVKLELFGPSDYALEEKLSDSPSNRYFCGVLYPRAISIDQENEVKVGNETESPLEQGEQT
ncbi:MAG: hypothetical protein ACI4QP_02815, partial [Candidatus Enteromonas sp.]